MGWSNWPVNSLERQETTPTRIKTLIVFHDQGCEFIEIYKSYRELATPDEAERWFNIFPKKTASDNIVNYA